MMQSIKGAEISTAGFTDKITKIILTLSSGARTHTKTAGVMFTAVTVRSVQSSISTNRRRCFPEITRQAVKCDRSLKSGSAREYATA